MSTYDLEDPDPDTWVRLGDLVTLHDIAKRSGVSLQAVANWAARDLGFPDPVRDEPRSRLWLWPDVERWLIDNKRQRYLRG